LSGFPVLLNISAVPVAITEKMANRGHNDDVGAAVFYDIHKNPQWNNRDNPHRDKFNSA
jgi:hypothetical protein